MVSHRSAELSRGQSAASGPSSPASSRSDSISFLPIHSTFNGAMSADSGLPQGNRRSSATPDSIDFRFLNFSHPQDAKNAQTRRNVRSHVTTKQHEKQRQRVAEQARQTQQGLQPSSSTSSSSVSRKNSGDSTAPSHSETETSSPEASSPSSPTASGLLTRLNPLEVYPEAWHSSLRPVMVCRCDKKIGIVNRSLMLSSGPLLQLYGR